MKLSEHFFFYKRKIFKTFFKIRINNRAFTIFSNDCWGGEMYKLLDRPYNTPFIGLMLMAPCYIKLLHNPKSFLNLPLIFKKESNYQEMRKKNAGVSYPLAELGDSGIEIHFLHYSSQEEVSAKWNRRIKRIDWQNLFVKFDFGKNYGNIKLAEEFLKLPFKNKLLIGKDSFGNPEIFTIHEYQYDAKLQFIKSFLYFDPVSWLKGDPKFTNFIHRFICRSVIKYI
jgi:uncharacterized protein (DUF1919 family)